jgi:hypothetical protein
VLNPLLRELTRRDRPPTARPPPETSRSQGNCCAAAPRPPRPCDRPFSLYRGDCKEGEEQRENGAIYSSSSSKKKRLRRLRRSRYCAAALSRDRLGGRGVRYRYSSGCSHSAASSHSVLVFIFLSQAARASFRDGNCQARWPLKRQLLFRSQP